MQSSSHNTSAMESIMHFIFISTVILYISILLDKHLYQKMNPKNPFPTYPGHVINPVAIKYPNKYIPFFHFKHLCSSLMFITKSQEDKYLIEIARF